jgi:hypothetical protein
MFSAIVTGGCAPEARRAVPLQSYPIKVGIYLSLAVRLTRAARDSALSSTLQGYYSHEGTNESS